MWVGKKKPKITPARLLFVVVIVCFNKFHYVTVSGDAVLLMAELLKIFVQGKDAWYECDTSLLNDWLIGINVFVSFPEAAVRSQKQAEYEDCDKVDIEHFEKILPQLVSSAAVTELKLYFN